MSLLAPGDDPAPAFPTLCAWTRAARTGAGSPWLSPGDAETLARHALARGLGVRLLEAAALTLHEPPRDTDWEILGADAPGANWDDHRDPSRALHLLLTKLRQARTAGARLQYKLWLGEP
ncbi:hypothetical protein AL036_12680 [Salipiger aestuarii]|uniref:Uncharacterized protein n=1 Tax=Salipiger aestuarii TaxID=568098 RepID=A0A327Y1F7_9RHOB|nr:hypothetical protein [Salipiger aestuarii]EIE50231.1 hypothetical protein C357_14826 [Citreicella sp. 357]KAA8606922.1 hypothetical protein AL036_12680 [Salipiger aestuarii]KAA8610794.1 hypothetical protein AL037_11985 [Salipiger aestuarii]KAB2541578.1 hypothetical protein AL035_11550 [Salipiger aestuarii]RAK14231.1 hypothetical protein ATI53_102832 [Salipiger aestuarii]